MHVEKLRGCVTCPRVWYACCTSRKKGGAACGDGGGGRMPFCLFSDISEPLGVQQASDNDRQKTAVQMKLGNSSVGEFPSMHAILVWHANTTRKFQTHGRSYRLWKTGMYQRAQVPVSAPVLIFPHYSEIVTSCQSVEKSGSAE